MNENQLSVGLDIGTQSVKCVICSHNSSSSEIIAYGHSKRLEIDDCDKQGYAEQDPAAWIEGIKEAIDSALGSFDESERVAVIKRIASIGVSGQQHGLVALDDAGDVLRPQQSPPQLHPDYA